MFFPGPPARFFHAYGRVFPHPRPGFPFSTPTAGFFNAPGRVAHAISLNAQSQKTSCGKFVETPARFAEKNVEKLRRFAEKFAFAAKFRDKYESTSHSTTFSATSPDVSTTVSATSPDVSLLFRSTPVMPRSCRKTFLADPDLCGQVCLRCPDSCGKTPLGGPDLCGKAFLRCPVLCGKTLLGGPD